MKLNTGMTRSSHEFMCTDTCAHTQTELCVLFSCRRPWGFMMSCVRVSSRPRDVAAACEAPGLTQQKSKRYPCETQVAELCTQLLSSNSKSIGFKVVQFKVKN